MHEYIFFYNTDYLLYTSMQYTINSVVDNFVRKSWLSVYHFLRLDFLEIELPSQKIWISDMWTRGEGEGGMNWESSIDIYTLPRVK